MTTGLANDVLFLHTQLYMLPEATYTLMLSSNIQTKSAATVPADCGSIWSPQLLAAAGREGGTQRRWRAAVAAAVATTQFQTAAADIITERTFATVLHTTTCCAEAHIL